MMTKTRRPEILTGAAWAALLLLVAAGPLAAKEPSDGCESCHQGIESMHADGDAEVGVTCVDCHGGNGTATTKEQAHVRPRNKQVFTSAANPKNSYAVLNQESSEFLRFMNPGDFRVAGETCGRCHESIYNRMLTSIMAHSAMVPQAGLYNNGIHPAKIPVYGEAYMPDGSPAIVEQPSDPVPGSALVQRLEPLQAFQITVATDAFRVLERGNNDAGDRGPGTDFHVAGGGIVLTKTRLNDPTLWFLGGNQSAGDYRNSGCTACHVLYANDRDEKNAGPELAEFYKGGGKSGYSASADPSISKSEDGHPVAHKMTVRVPVSQCLTCHHHQGNGALGNYVGAMWWDQESDADKILSPGVGRDKFNSEAKRLRLYDDNPTYRDVQIEDWHGHSWNFRRVYSMNRHGELLDAEGSIVPHDDPERFQKAVHLKDIHFERGMHCIDCHTEQDIHGDNRIWGSMIDAIEIRCEDCHGTVTERAKLVTSGVAGGNPLADRRTAPRVFTGRRQFEVKRDGRIVQRSKIYEGLTWEIPQLVDTVDPSNSKYNERAARAKTMRYGGEWGGATLDPSKLAHANAKMECYTCHSAWNTQCYGCHLSADVNRKESAIHWDSRTTKAYVQYNPMLLRADGFLIGINGTAKGNKYSPMRSASAVVASARDGNRNEVVHQQPTIAASGHSGYAVTPNPPHTVRTTESRSCTDCHVSEANDNNAWLAAVFGMGTNSVNFLGEYAYVATGKRGVEAVKVTEGVEPQPVIGSEAHRRLAPASFARFTKGGRELKTAYGAGTKFARGVATRGEFVFVADGPGGFKVFDRANISNKAKAQRLVRAQNSRLGQKTHVRTADATSVALPSSVPMNADRKQLPMNLEQPVSDLFRYAFISDRKEGLIVVDVHTFHDHNPRNNQIRRVVTYNPEGKLSGALQVTLGGNYAYVISQNSGLHVVDISDPRSPRWLAKVGSPQIRTGRAVAVQLRYAFVADSEGFKVVDVTHPDRPRLVEGATVPLEDARSIYPVRTYAYVAAGSEGLAIIDIEKVEEPKLVETYSAGGAISDANAVTTGTVNATSFAFVADGKNGLRVLRMIGPAAGPGHLGFSPRPRPELIATYRTDAPALAVAEGTKRDQAIDASGNQIGVGGRLGSHPLRQENLDRLLFRDGEIYTVTD